MHLKEIHPQRFDTYMSSATQLALVLDARELRLPAKLSHIGQHVALVTYPSIIHVAGPQCEPQIGNPSIYKMRGAVPSWH